MRQAVLRSESEVTALHFLRKPMGVNEQHSSGQMPWQSRNVRPETELLAIGTARGALHVFDWQGRLLLDLPQAIPGMVLLVRPPSLCCVRICHHRCIVPSAFVAALLTTCSMQEDYGGLNNLDQHL